MNINTTSHPALANPATPLSQGRPIAQTVRPHPFTTLLQQTRQPIGHGVPSHMRSEASSLAAQAAMNHTR